VKLFARSVKWTMLASGILTFTMIYALVSPYAALQSTFGATLETGPVADIVVRSWGALIGLVGLMLIYAAFRPAVRFLVLMVAVSSKMVFIGLVLTRGSALVKAAVAVPVLLDSTMILLFVAYLASKVYVAEPDKAVLASSFQV
jgi:hypothetical protein